MLNSLAISALSATVNAVPALPVGFNRPAVDSPSWALQVTGTGVKVGDHAYLTSFDVNSSKFVMHGTNKDSGWDNECIVVEVASNASTDRFIKIAAADVRQRRTFQAEYVSLVKAMASQPSDAIVDDAVMFSKVIKEVDWHPSVWSDDGEIVFEWIDEERHAVVSLEGDGYMGYAMRIGGNFVSGSNTEASVSHLPLDLKDYLQKA